MDADELVPGTVLQYPDNIKLWLTILPDPNDNDGYIGPSNRFSLNCGSYTISGFPSV